MATSSTITSVSPLRRRVLARTFSSVALATTLTQILFHLQILSAGAGNRCDYPEGCVTYYFPALWVTIRTLWLVTLIISIVALATRFAIADVAWSKFWAALAMVCVGISIALFPMRNDFDRSAAFRGGDAILVLSAVEWLGIAILVGSALAHVLALFMKPTEEVERNRTNTRRV